MFVNIWWHPGSSCYAAVVCTPGAYFVCYFPTLGPSDEREFLGVSSLPCLSLWVGDEIDPVPVLERLETNVEDR